MKNKEFNSASPQTLVYGFTSCFKNAEQHLAIAELLKEKDFIGHAIPHLITGTEECIKAIAYLNKLINKRQLNVGGLFTRHGVKHKSIKDLLEPFSKIFTFFNTISSQQKRPNTLRFPESKFLLSELSIERLENWYKSVEQTRKAGLYVDYRDNIFHTPCNLTMTDYDDNYLILSILISPLKVFNDIDKLSNEEIDDITQMFQ